MEFLMNDGEWYVWTLVLISILTILMMPKKNLTWAGVFITLSVGGYLAWFSNSVIGSSIDLFDLAQKKTTEFSDASLLTFVPPCIATIYVNFYNPQKGWFFAITFTLVCFVLEWLLVIVGYMENINWKTWYGIPVYFFFFKFFFPFLLRLLSKKLVKTES
ncbi:hypothetical protein [Metabacillus arenae]|uniref:Uncharacterized protein n=1 Tax=Metabacillus arenae TaxID=2771434 RepID=A0A926NK14_9BACI|nr:hypothetical protein [Metabacillus arenae]MBD1382018.1 hypothetical protein [Metabacillus arenae]